MSDLTYISKETYDSLSLLDPKYLSEEDKKDMYAYIVFNIIVNIALAKQRGVEIEKTGMAKELLTLPNEILKFIADSMIEKMKTTVPINVIITIDKTFIDAFGEIIKKFYAKNPHLISILKMQMKTRRTEKKRIDVRIILNKESNEYDYQIYAATIKKFFIDIIAEKDLPIDQIEIEYDNGKNDF